MSYSEKLAGYIIHLNYDSIAENTKKKVKYCIIDWLGAVYAAYKYNNKLSDMYISFALKQGGIGKYLIIGSEHKTSLLWSVFANAALGHIAEVDDGHRTSIMHPGAVVIPVAFGLSFEKELTGKKFIEAIIGGYEIAIRVGECLGENHYSIWHTTATAGTFGSTATAAKIMNLNEKQIIYALGHAGTQAAGLWQFLLDGYAEAKPLHPAKAVLNGILSAQLAEQNLKGAKRIFEGDKGLCKATSSKYDLDKLDYGLGESFKVDTVNFKAYPTCGQTHTAIDAMKKLSKKYNFKYINIDKIDIFIYQRAIDIAGIKCPHSIEEAKFSIPFCIATLLIKGDITFHNLSDEDLDNPDIRRLMKKVKLKYDSELNQKFPKCRPCRVYVYLNNGKKIVTENYFRKGDPENPMNEEEIIEKFNQLTDKVISKSRARSIVDSVLNLEHAKNLDNLCNMLVFKK